MSQLTAKEVRYLVQQYRIMRPLFKKQKPTLAEHQEWRQRWLIQFALRSDG